MLLPPRFDPAARDIAAGPGRRGARAPVGELHPDRLVQQAEIAVAIEDAPGNFNLAAALLGGGEQRQLNRCNARLSHWWLPVPLRCGDAWRRASQSRFHLWLR